MIVCWLVALTYVAWESANLARWRRNRQVIRQARVEIDALLNAAERPSRWS
jgi:hypothetical protein